LRFGSVCSGIEAASVAWEPIGWKAAWFAEIEPFPCAVLKHHYPDTPNLGDMNLWKEWPDAAIDVLCGGTPCQSFSVAGLRKGLDDPRGNLMLTFLAIAKRHRPRWLVWENVPGVLSSNGGRDFGSFLGGLAECGYGFAYRVLDAQYFGLAQRRKRVFVVAHLGNWRPAAAVLFERASLCGHPAPRREAGERPAPSVTSGAPNGGPGHGARSGSAKEGLIVPVAFGGNRTSGPIDVAPALNACGTASGRQDFETEAFITTHTLRGEGFDASEDGTGRGTPLVPVATTFRDTADCLTSAYGTKWNGNASADNGSLFVAQPYTLAIRGRGDGHNLEFRQDGTANALLTPNGGRGGIGVGAIAHAFDARQSDVIQYGDKTGPLDTDGHSVGVLAFDTTQITSKANVSNPKHGDPCHPLAAGAHAPAVAFDTYNQAVNEHTSQTIKSPQGAAQESVGAVLQAMQVRRLTPVECERLQGFPDHYTAISWRGKPADQCPDGPRYKALGNSWAVPVVRWIGERINLVDSVLEMQREVAA